LSGITAGYGVLEARVKVLKNGSYVLDQVYNANTQFDSSFFGDYAVTIAKTQYPLLVRKFLRNLYSDPAFIKAVKK
jgi:hypothetical protein